MLEVGLGGRLDAVNVVDADCAVLTSVGIDHVDYLGADRESIGREKAGIFRRRPAGRDRRAGSAAPVLERGGNKLLLGKRFRLRRQESAVDYWGPGGKRGGLAHPALRGAISCAMRRRRCARSTRCATAAGRDAGRPARPRAR